MMMVWHEFMCCCVKNLVRKSVYTCNLTQIFALNINMIVVVFIGTELTQMPEKF